MAKVEVDHKASVSTISRPGPRWRGGGGVFREIDSHCRWPYSSKIDYSGETSDLSVRRVR